MAGLPQVGGDAGNWGTKLNDFLKVAHNTDGTTKGSMDVINVRDFGAHSITEAGFENFDSTNAIQAAIDAAELTGGIVFFPAGTYLCEVIVGGTYGAVNLEGVGAKSQLKAITAGHFAVTYNTYNQWTPRWVRGLRFTGNTRTTGGVELTTGSAASSISFDNCDFVDCTYGVKKTGAIGNYFSNCHFGANGLGNNFGFYAEDQVDVMHAGCDWFYGCNWEWNLLAGVCYYTNNSGDHIAFRDCIVESNVGFGFFIKGIAGGEFERGIIFDNVWFENNATAGSVTINEVAYTPRAFYFNGVRKASITNMILMDGTELVNSTVHTYNCSCRTDDTIKDNNSQIFHHSLASWNAAGTCHVNDRIEGFRFPNSALDGGGDPQRSGISGRVIDKSQPTKSVTNLLTNGSCAVDFVLGDAGGRSYGFEVDGLIYKKCLYIDFGAAEPGTSKVIPWNLTALDVNTFYVWSMAVKGVGASGYLSCDLTSVGNSLLRIHLMSPLVIEDGKWITYSGIARSNPTLTGDVGFAIYNPSAYALKVRFTDVQVVKFIDKDNAMDFADSCLYAESSDASILNQMIGASATWNPGSIAIGAKASTSVIVTGVALGDFAVASFDKDIQGLTLSANVTSVNTVTCVLANNTGASVTLGSGTIYVRVMKK